MVGGLRDRGLAAVFGDETFSEHSWQGSKYFPFSIERNQDSLEK